MLLVLFAVALGLPASKGKRSSFDPFGCYHALSESGNIYCQLSGYDKFKGLDFETCKLDCEGPKVQLPKEACPNGSLQSGCTAEVVETLKTWSVIMMKMKGNAMKKWCPNA
uniref:Putative ixodes 10 kDa peptide protein n=1 Tax=Ixodes ricinus TaxID=34613 RepID=A0A0K8RE93_IXORI